MNKRKSRGLPPGTVLYTGTKNHIDVKVNYVRYNETDYEEEIQTNESTFQIHHNIVDQVQWYDVRGLHDIELINLISKTYNMHPVSIENAVDIYQRPIYQEFEDAHFMSLKHLRLSKSGGVERQTVSIYFGRGFVLTFQEDENDLLASVRNRIKNTAGRIRSKKEDYLAYAIIDLIVDDYFTVLDAIEERIELQEDAIAIGADNIDKSSIYHLKKELLKVRKSIGPLREAVNQWSRTESSLIDEKTKLFIRDVYDHIIQITDNVDSLRDVLSGLQDLYNSEVSLKMNRIMQFLTIVTAIFVPISFLTGLYGMNFEYIPELKHRSGYFILWGVMLTSILGMLLWFKKKKWL